MSATAWCRFHKIVAVLWFIAAFPIMFSSLAYSIPLLVFISIYANVAGHWSSAQAASAEKKVDG